MKKKIICLGVIGTIMVNMLACSKGQLSGSTENLMDAYGEKNTSEIQSEAAQISIEDEAEFKENYADFAVEVLKNTAESGENSMISPLSLLTALTMTENGAGGETLSQMEQVIANGISVEKQNQELVNFIRRLPNTEKSHLHQANSIWFQGKEAEEKHWVKEVFLQKNADTFQADIFRAPFNHDTLKDINVWVSNETEGMISQVLDEIPPDAVMYLINAVAFEAEWERTYDKSQIIEAEFLQEDGTSKPVSMMYSNEFQYLEDGDTTGFIKPYADGYSFVALLPAEGITMEHYISNLSGKKWMQLLENVSERERVRAGIPKFNAEYEEDMATVLADMGMPLAFDETQADFSGIGDKELSISRVLHKTYVSVDGLGTKAGAATVVETSKSAGMDTDKEVILNRPFVYAIVDDSTNLPIFLGIVEQLEE